jgi:signal transduction histidine kinase
MTGDETMLWIAISNLIDNAIKFAHMRTEVRVVITLRTNAYMFEVINTGVYLHEHERERIFRPYVRGLPDDNLNRRPGTGLGLPVSRMLLKAHHEDAHLDFTSDRSPDRTSAKTRLFFKMPYFIGTSMRAA